ncbi:MAG: GMC family oxidoreductase N-terminal domain-containing protein, partial [Planctomycetes bacterium]|nr:GMC family oxidoreductase N-terminal domain-containing protein [Planctomycetota bacterium]
WVPMAEARGAEVLSEVRVVELEHRRGVVCAARCIDLRSGKGFRVRAQRFVLAAGALATPELLLRSKLGGPRVGHGVSFNAGAIAFAEYPEEVDGHLGDQMCVHHFDARFVIEQVHNPELSFALTLPGTFAQHAELMRRYRRLASAGVLVPSQPVGRVFFGLGARLAPALFDHAELRFRLPAGDLAALREGLKTLARVYFASGATRVLVPSRIPLELQSAREIERIDAVIRSQSDLTNFGSSHPFGGAAIGEDARTAPVDPEHRLRGVANLFVCDASIFPRALRVNPMLTIMAVADRAARFLGVEVPQHIAEGPVHEARQRRERARAAQTGAAT